MTRTSLLPALLLGLLVGAAHADVVVMKDGRLFDGVETDVAEDQVTIYFPHGEVTISTDDVKEIVVSDMTGFVPKTDEERTQFEKGLVPFEGRWMSVAKREKRVQTMLDEKRAEIDEMKATRLWRNRFKEETENFAFEVTVPRHVFESYRDLCEAYFDEFVKMWKIKKPKDIGKLRLKFYIDKEAFYQVSDASPGVLGYFRFVKPYELNIYYDRLDPLGTEEVMYHEVGHYLQKLIDVEFKYPHWPGEALCEYYAASVWDPVKKKLDWGGIHEGRLTQIHQDIERDDWVYLEPMITGCQDRNFHDYTWGWSFVHFLMQDKKRAKNFKKFYIALARGRDIERSSQQYGRDRLASVGGEDMLAAFMKYMKIKDMEELKELEEDWHQYIQEELQVTTARGLENAAFRSLRSGRPQRAKRLYEEAIEAGTQLSLTFHRYADLLDGLGEDEQAAENWEKAIELDPLVPDYYIAWGEAMLRSEETAAEGERMLRLALDIEPDNYYLERNLEAMLKSAENRIKRAKARAEREKDDDDDEGETQGE